MEKVDKMKAEKLNGAEGKENTSKFTMYFDNRYNWKAI